MSLLPDKIDTLRGGGLLSNVRTIGAATLICGDAYAIAPTLGAFDAIVTDPPYVIDTSGGGRYRRARTHLDRIAQEELGIGFDVAILNPLLYAAVVVFCNDEQLALVAPHIAGNWHRHALCHWHKTNAQPVANKHYRPDVELWFHGWNRGHHPAGTLDEKSRVFTGPAVRGPDRFDHPTPKPLALMRRIMANVAGASVIDPFMGTGTTGVAAIEAGKRFVGIEHNPKHFLTAIARIEAAVAAAEAASPGLSRSQADAA